MGATHLKHFPMPVSYTHLDVYKRQVLGVSWEFMFVVVCFELSNSGGGMLPEIAPPSYRRSPEISGGEWI